MTGEKYDVLKRFFGYSSFRSGQEELIDAQMEGRDVLGVMPTGGGKSLCYQIPAILMPGITLVVSPLISLMKDQVMALKAAGIPAAYINSSLSMGQINRVYQNLLEGRYKIVYIAPERLMTEGFLSTAQRLRISLLAVDEAHCISQWGQDFRPSYLRISEFVGKLRRRPVVSAFTATATERVRRDIERSLGLDRPLRIVTGFDRQNLRFEVIKPKKKDEALLALVSERAEKSGIVYCSTRRDVESVWRMLRGAGFAATRYHAGLTEEERRNNQDDFIYDGCNIMVATNAFGMGIDKSNVSYVIHYNMPQSIESYYQEAGRAGRDGSDADCILLYSARDIRTAQFLIEHSGGSEELTEPEQSKVTEQALKRLGEMVGYCETDRCLRGYILDYFGQKHPKTCGNCGNCDGSFSERDITEEAGAVFECVRLVRERIGYSLGSAKIMKTLRGGRDKETLALGLDRLPVYGRLRGVSSDALREMMESLKTQGYLRVDPVHGALFLTPRAEDAVRRHETVTMRVRGKSADSSSSAKRTAAGTEEDGLYAALRDLRYRAAKEEGVPAFMVFSNATLRDMAAKKPTTESEMLSVAGVGQKKLQLYGKRFTEEIKRYLTENGG